MRFPSFSRCFLPLILVFGVAGERAMAQAPSQIENPRRANSFWVADSAGVLTEAEERRINAVCAAFKSQTDNEMAVVVVRNLAGKTIKEYANELFRTWGIGGKGRDNGILLLDAVDERQMRIEVGYGLEGDLPDGKTGEIRRTQIAPYLSKLDYANGLYAGTVAVAKAIKPSFTPPADGAALPPQSEQESQPSAGGEVVPSDSNSPMPAVPIVGGGLIIALMGLLVFLFPLLLIGGVVWYFTAAMKRPLRCSKCRAPVQQLSDAAELPSLSPVQQFEQKIGARDYRVWRCQNCHNEDITAHDLPNSQFQQCPTCRHQTASVLIEPLRAPTPWQSGLERVILSCQWSDCKHSNFYQRATPPAPRGGYGGNGYGRGYGSSGSDLLTGIVLGSILNGSNHSGGWSGGDSGGGWSGGGDSGGLGGGFDSGPGDFGGGDSGGGGSDGGY